MKPESPKEHSDLENEVICVAVHTDSLCPDDTSLQLDLSHHTVLGVWRSGKEHFSFQTFVAA